MIDNEGMKRSLNIAERLELSFDQGLQQAKSFFLHKMDLSRCGRSKHLMDIIA